MKYFIEFNPTTKLAFALHRVQDENVLEKVRVSPNSIIKEVDEQFANSIDLLENYQLQADGSILKTGNKTVTIINEDVSIPQVPKTQFTKLEFRRKFTVEELANLYIQAETDPVIKIFLDDLSLAEYIDITDQRTVDAISYLVSKGYLTQARADEILTPEVV